MPIDLTAEWLLNFDFKYDGYLYYVEEHRFNVLIVPKSPLIFEISVFWKGVYIRDILHVHQLQNLFFSLTDEELKISK